MGSVTRYKSNLLFSFFNFMLYYTHDFRVTILVFINIGKKFLMQLELPIWKITYWKRNFVMKFLLLSKNKLWEKTCFFSLKCAAFRAKTSHLYEINFFVIYKTLLPPLPLNFPPFVPNIDLKIAWATKCPTW
jgi:hypothetical protein